jgi:acyl carrier protein
MSMENIAQITNKIINIINDYAENVNIGLEQKNEDLYLLGMNSISFIQIVVALEETFSIEIPDEKLLVSEMGTLNKMVNIVSTELKIEDE